MLIGSLIALASQALAQTPPRDFVGTYADGPDHKIEIGANAKGELFAIVDGADYPLKRTGRDQLTNVGGQIIPFRRDSNGEISGYVDEGQFHSKLSSQISPDIVLDPRPAGGVYHYAPPPDLHDGIGVGDIRNSPLGVSTANAIVSGVVDGKYPGVHSVLLYQNGRLVMEEYFYGYSVHRQQQLRSATKSVVGALAGIAVDHGALTLDDPALPLVKVAHYKNPDPRKPKITIRDFLTMSSGLACNDHSSDSPGRETVLDDQPDWVQAMYDLPQVNDPGKVGFYCSGGVAVVGRAVENSVGMSLPDYADRELFEPLGIQRFDWSWNYNLTNEDKEFSQIHMRPRDMLKLGVLFADGGVWRGRRIISKTWVDAALSGQSTVDDTEYGYFWWRPWLNVDGTRVYVNAAQGNGGQKIYIASQYKLVAVFTGGDYNTQSPMNRIMIEDILPKLMAANPDGPAKH
jgi:CubicO group peptidase (beta-lactamase class C family)